MRTTFLLSIMLLMSSCGTLKALWSTSESRYLATLEMFEVVKTTVRTLADNDKITNVNDLARMKAIIDEVQTNLDDWDDAIKNKKSNASGFEALTNSALKTLTILTEKYEK